MAEHAALYVAGTFAEPAADLPARPVTSPVTAEHLADLPVATADQIDRAVAASPPGWCRSAARPDRAPAGGGWAAWPNCGT